MQKNSTIFVTVQQEDNEIRLDRWLKRYHPDITHSLLEKMLRKKLIRVDNKKAKANQIIHTGQKIRIPAYHIYNTPKTTVKQQPLTIDDHRFIKDITIYEDENMLIVNKPSGMATQGGNKVKKNIDDLFKNMADELASGTGDRSVKYKLVHRIDKDTSGILCIAKNAKAANILTKKFQDRTVSKQYISLINSVLPNNHGTIDLAINKGTGKYGREQMVIDQQNGQSAITHYKVIEQARKEISLVMLKPVTGRKHQLRVHMLSQKCQIIGDRKYCANNEPTAINDFADKLHLHAYQIIIDDFFGKTVRIAAPLPEYFLDSLNFLGININILNNIDNELL
ncbi:MAG: RluA family pseudouridine synthase [Pseudomonadota bacterium]